MDPSPLNRGLIMCELCNQTLPAAEKRGKQPDEWLFEPRMLGTLRRATRLRRDLELDWEAIALAVTLIEQVHALRGDNARLRQQLAFLLDTNNND